MPPMPPLPFPRGSSEGEGAGPDGGLEGAAARLAFGGKALDCVVLRLALDSALVRLAASADVPGLATLELPGGERLAVRCAWQNGPMVGLVTAAGADPAAS